MVDGLDWGLVTKALEAALGEDSFYLEPDRIGGTIVKGQATLAIVSRVRNNYTLSVSFRASVRPNTAAMVASALALVGFKLELDSYFEFDNNGVMVAGPQATRFFAENAKFILLGERDPSPGATVVRPKGPYTKHHFN